MLVGPWYRWASPAVPASGRLSAPVIHKYETAEMVNEFLKNPQRSLKFPDTEDWVFAATPRVPSIPLLNGRRRVFSVALTNAVERAPDHCSCAAARPSRRGFVATGLLALLDDITSILDDVSAMTKVAAVKTAGVLGDDLALNAQQVAEVRADRELPVVWAVAKGSALNKAILVPTALAISAFTPWLVTPLLMLGGAYLCFEGVEKLAHPWLHKAAPGPHAPPQSEDERAKVRAAVRTDFVLSAEIIVITLGTVAGRPLATQIGVMVGIAALMTVGVYGLVAGIVRLDDIGLYLSRFPAGARRRLGRAILTGAPYLMRTLSVVGTAAMFLVGGGILTHGLPGAHEAIDHLAEPAADVPLLGGVLGPVAVLVANGLAGVLAGAAVFGLQRGARAALAALGIGLTRNAAGH